MSQYTVSIVIPLYNEEDGIEVLIKELSQVLTQVSQTCEVIFVNDGSTDHTEEKIRECQLNYPFSLISFSRNFGHQAALLAGMKAAKGDFVITMDGDLQHPPELIPHFLQLHAKGFDIVLTERKDTYSLGQKSIFSYLFYKLLNCLSDTQIQKNSSDFRSLSRQALEAVLSLDENRKFLRGIVEWVGFRSTTVMYQPNKRRSGVSKYTFLKMIRLAFYGITSFSTIPLYISGLFSFALFALSFMYGLYVLFVTFFLKQSIQGWASVILVLLILGGFFSLFLGLIGVYLAGIYEEVKNRPQYITKKVSRFNYANT